MGSSVVVIGAGLAGASVAWHLSADTDVLVLEQGLQPGREATSQNAGMVRRLGEDPTERALAMRTHAFLMNPGEDWAGQSPSRKTGAVLGLVHEPGHLNDAVAHLRARGVVVERCRDVSNRAPALAGCPLSVAWYLPNERVADPQLLMQGFLRGARRKGTVFRCGVQVTALRHAGGRIVGVDTTDGPVDADRVVLAGGAWCANLMARVGLYRPLIPLRRTLLSSHPHGLSSVDHPWCWVDDVGVYVRPEAGGWLLSGCDESVEQPPNSSGSEGLAQDEYRTLALDKVHHYLPALSGLTIADGWTGLRTFAPDRAPILGEDPELSGLWWAAGLGGFGVTCCVGVGEVVATWMRGGHVEGIHPPTVSPGRRFLSRWPIRPTGYLNQARLIRAG